MSVLLLQKTFLNSKSKENSETPKPRILLSKNRQLDQLMLRRKQFETHYKIIIE